MPTTETKSVPSEFQRIRKLSELDLDYLELHEEVKNLLELAGMIAETETSMLNFLDHHTQWSVYPDSPQPEPTPREESVCNYTIQNKTVLEIPRLDLDQRFADKDFVKGTKGLKYYLGIPLNLDSGESIGALCMVDRSEMHTTQKKIKALGLIAEEIVDKLETRKKLNESLYSLSEAVRIKNQVAHDVRGPINGIAGLAEVVESEELSEEEMREYFKLIKDSGHGILNLTTEILESGKAAKVFKSRYINLSRLEEKLLQLYHLSARTKHIDLRVIANPEKSTYLFPKRKLLSIMGNLISNAIKFTPENGKIIVELDIKNSENGRQIEMKVSDTGLGFSESSIRDFYNDDLRSSVGIKGEKGFGLGLKLVKEMVHDLDGQIKITSGLGEGTKIEVRLPLK
ncbi:GAF domain-containing sensor histidine kinase [Pontixanthobacter gangjinensis]|uniref:histidine kinase n=1 Tax=Christiangramia aestuarii TaxID=1028746 RepID=A0A7K1LR72_9FLAO|nr:GAF domain-containing sensor histidine kinase [Christiangramia aestuarii]MUP43111.1 GAF domain-containing sensor histidine kinase [Christiangramia aestuarii]